MLHLFLVGGIKPDLGKKRWRERKSGMIGKSMWAGRLRMSLFVEKT